jgi:thioesterase domain-containing protein/acyl carrier protein
MVPSAFVTLDELPLTPNDKIDRQALPPPERERAAREEVFVEPRTAIEELLARIWGDVLGLPRVGIHDNFFELGGHSLLAVKLISRIEKEFGRKLPLHLLFQGATIDRLALLLQQGPGAKGDAPFIEIQPAGTRPPLFVLPSFTGSLLFWKRFLPYMGGDQPVFGLTLPVTSEGRPSFVDFETLGARCVERLIAAQPEGAFRIAGFSIGGLLAFEIARQLHAKGRRVDFVGVIDAYPNRGRRSLAERLRLIPSFLLNLPIWLLDDVRHSSGRRVRKRLQIDLHKVLSRVVGRSASRWCKPRTGTGRWALSDPAAQAYVGSMGTYFPGPYSGRVTLIRTRSQPPFQFQPCDYGWGELADRVDVRVVPGCFHQQMVAEPHVRDVAAALQSALDATI